MAAKPPRFSAPARIDLAGGTLDVAPLCFLIEESLTLNLAIDLRAEIGLVPGDLNRAELILQGQSFPPADHPLFQLALQYFKTQDILKVVSDSRIPRASGLGGSSSILVSLVAALGLHSGKVLNQDELLGAVTVLEHRLLGKPAGVQDALAAIYGGLNEIGFRSGSPKIKQLSLPAFLSGPLYLAYCKVQHHSGLNNWAVIHRACEGDEVILNLLQFLARNAQTMSRALRECRTGLFLECLERESHLRNQLSDKMLTDDMRAFNQRVKHKVITKVCGAGGGGCMFLMGKEGPLEREYLEFHALATGLEIIVVSAEPQGCREVES